MEISFDPKPLSNMTGKNHYIADTQTAGSICLLIQCALPVCVFFPAQDIHLVLKGGTNASNAPQIDYTQSVFTPIASLFGVDFSMRILRRGYYPKGGGELELVCKCISPQTSLKPIQLTDRGHITSFELRTFYSALPQKVCLVIRFVFTISF
jgi:RNA 3'-terminal phosphate cyclase (ATP)